MFFARKVSAFSSIVLNKGTQVARLHTFIFYSIYKDLDVFFFSDTSPISDKFRTNREVD